MRKPKELSINNPELVTISDCELAYQMGYKTEAADGEFKSFTKEDKR
jgi:hypothetical protein